MSVISLPCRNVKFDKAFLFILNLFPDLELVSTFHLLHCAFYFLLLSLSNKKINIMSKLIYWIIFIVSTSIMVWLLMFHAEWFWVMLPFVGVSIVKALDII